MDNVSLLQKLKKTIVAHLTVGVSSLLALSISFMSIQKTGFKSTIVVAPTMDELGSSALFDRLSELDGIVYIGEVHDDLLHHKIQLDIIKGIHQRRNSLSIGLEMLDFTLQNKLDGYLNGHITPSNFKKLWNEKWGYFSLYEPILTYAKDHDIPVFALNAPPSTVHKIITGGLNSLTANERQQLPRQIRISKNEKYLNDLEQNMWGSHRTVNFDDTKRIDQLILAHSARDQKMANSILSSRAKSGVNRAGPMVVLAGELHLVYRGGIVEQVAIENPKLPQTVVLPFLSEPYYRKTSSLTAMFEVLKDNEHFSHDIMSNYFWLENQIP